MRQTFLHHFFAKAEKRIQKLLFALQFHHFNTFMKRDTEADPDG
ncbi:MAG: hypothetical protein ACI865_001033 [Flavobacteriaceae bacterium]|jgi:hypothetical protein